MSIWRIQSTTQDGSSNTSWEKVSAALLFKTIKTRWSTIEAHGEPIKTSSKCFPLSDASYLMKSAWSSYCNVHSRPEHVSIQPYPHRESQLRSNLTHLSGRMPIEN